MTPTPARLAEVLTCGLARAAPRARRAAGALVDVLPPERECGVEMHARVGDEPAGVIGKVAVRAGEMRLDFAKLGVHACLFHRPHH